MNSMLKTRVAAVSPVFFFCSNHPTWMSIHLVCFCVLVSFNINAFYLHGFFTILCLSHHFNDKQSFNCLAKFKTDVRFDENSKQTMLVDVLYYDNQFASTVNNFEWFCVCDIFSHRLYHFPPKLPSILNWLGWIFYDHNIVTVDKKVEVLLIVLLAPRFCYQNQNKLRIKNYRYTLQMLVFFTSKCRRIKHTQNTSLWR